MRTAKQTKSKKKPTTVIVSAVAVILIGGAIFAWFSPSVHFFGVTEKEDRPNNTVDYNKSTNSQKEAGDTIKQDFIDTKYGDDKKEGQGTEKPAIAVNFSSMSQDNGNLSMRVIIETSKKGGSCELILTKGNAVVNRVAGMQSMGSYNTCRGFDIPLSELSAGSWQASVSYIDNTGASYTAKKQVQINE